MAKTAIITGSARGIGAAIALRLAKDGYNIALNDISEAMFENNDIMDKIKALGVECEKYICDVSSHAQCEAMVKSVKERFGTIDCLVNNAGITRDGLMARMPEEQYDLVIAVNQKSVFNMTKFAGNVMMRQRSGKIINLASVAGLYGNPEEQRNKMLEQIAMKRYGEVEEIAGVVSFLASDDASYVTGQIIEISGGLMM